MTASPDVRLPRHRSAVPARVLAVCAATLAAVLIWVVAVPILGVELQAPAGPGSTELHPVPLLAVVGMSLASSLAGWALLAVLERFTSRAPTTWTVIACAVLVVSYGGPLLGAGVPSWSRVTLALMHAAVGAALITLLRRSPSGATA